jgi:DNA helicase IV
MGAFIQGAKLSIDTEVRNLAYEEELAAEQEYFDAAQEASVAASAEKSTNGFVPTNKVEQLAWLNFKSKSQTDSLAKSVAIGRIDPENETELYIGRHAIWNDDKDLLVVSWKSEAAVPFYRASTEETLGLARKRTFECSNNTILQFDDFVFAELSEAFRELGGTAATDDSLLSALGAARNGEMADIVKTIQAAQDRIVRAEKDQLLIVQGGPGTGKTAVALHRISWLLYTYQGQLAPSDVLVIGPNPTFTRYIKKVLPDLGDNDVVQRSLHDFLAPGASADGHDSRETAALKGSGRMADVISAALDARITLPREPVRLRRTLSASAVTLSPQSVAAEIARLRVQPYAKGRAMLRERFQEMSSAVVKGLGGLTTAVQLSRQSLDTELERLWPSTTGPQLIQELLGSAVQLTAAGKGILNPSEVQALHRPAKKKLSEEKWTLADLALIDEAMESIGAELPLFGHIVIDEAQDLSEMQLRAVRRRSRNGSMTVVGDIAQSTGPHARDSWETVLQQLRSRLPHKIEELQEGYRVPKEVFDVARPVLAVAAPAINAPRIVRWADVEPVFSGCRLDNIAVEVAAVASHHSGKGRFVGVVAPEELWPQLRQQFKTEDMQWRESLDGELSHNINLVTPQDCKGLEFDVVIVVDPAAILAMPLGERLLYIALTRTTTRLDVIYPDGTLPELLGGPDETATPKQPTEPPVPEQTGAPEPFTVDDQLRQPEVKANGTNVLSLLLQQYKTQEVQDSARTIVSFLASIYQPEMVELILQESKELTTRSPHDNGASAQVAGSSPTAS